MNHEIRQTKVFADWLLNLRDMRARIAIARRIDRVSTGNLGDFKSVAMAYLSCALISAPAIACISPCAKSRS